MAQTGPGDGSLPPGAEPTGVYRISRSRSDVTAGVAVIWTVAASVVVVRLWVRVRARHRLSWDDVLIVPGLVSKFWALKSRLLCSLSEFPRCTITVQLKSPALSQYESVVVPRQGPFGLFAALPPVPNRDSRGPAS